MNVNFCRQMRLLALRYGDRPALINVERNRRYSYAEYHSLTNRIASVLRTALRVGRGNKFFLILENDNLSLLHFPTFFKQEGTVAFGNYRDPMEEHERQIDLLKPKVVFIENEKVEPYYEMLRRHGCTIVTMDPPTVIREEVLSFWDLVERASDADNDVELDSHDHVTALRFTGGTTGRGKCAMYTIDNLLGTRDGAYVHRDFELDEGTRFLHFAPLSHGSMMFFFPTLFAGGASYTQNLPDLEQWSRVVEAENITHSFLVPTLLYRLLDMQAAQTRDLSSLRTVAYGAAPMSPTKLGDLIARFGAIFMQAYAATEAAMFVSVLDKADHRIDNEHSARRLSSAGRIAPGVEVYIADDSGRPLPAGETGEIMIRCRATIQGYYLNPEATAAEFTNGTWRSGDLGYIDDGGYLYIVDRKKDMIISGGFNIYAVEVEAALASHPAVLMCAVVGVPHAEWGEAVHAEVVLRSGLTATAEELIAHVKNKIGGYKAPKTASLVDSLPLTAVGKVLRRVVKEKYWKDQARKVG
jgi:acyl-CoA synthetase (AMP-forming)/AMP-acid ligase II